MYERLYTEMLTAMRAHMDAWRWLDNWGWRWSLNRCPHGEGATEVHVWLPQLTGGRLATLALANAWALRMQAQVRTLENLALLIAQERRAARPAALEPDAPAVLGQQQ